MLSFQHTLEFTWEAVTRDLHNSGLLESLYQELVTGKPELWVFLIETDQEYHND